MGGLILYFKLMTKNGMVTALVDMPKVFQHHIYSEDKKENSSSHELNLF